MATASLVVRILADINSFSAGMEKAEKEILRTSQRMQSLGASLSLGVTLPFVALGAAMAKAAAEDEASVKKLQRTFGAASSAMEGFITDLMRTVPATDDELRGLTVSTDTLLRSIGLLPAKATAMTQAVTRLAGDLAAFAHVEIGVAQSTLEKALAGQTRGLKEFGIVISEADIKQRAYKLGLAQTGQELTHAATAQAAWSLILERSKSQQGEAARTIGDSANALARLRQAMDGVTDSFGAIFLPTAARVVGAIANLLNGINNLTPATKGFVVTIGAIVAAAGPAIFIIGALVEKVILLRRAFIAMEAAATAGSLVAAFGSLAAFGPLAAVVVAALGALTFAWVQNGKAARQAAADIDRYKVALLGASRSDLVRTLQEQTTQLQSLEAKRRAILALIPGAPNNRDLGNVPGSRIDLENQLKKVDAQAKAVKVSMDPVVGQLVAMNDQAIKLADNTEPVVTSFKAIEDRAQAIIDAFELIKNGMAPFPGLGAAFVDEMSALNRVIWSISDPLDATRLKAEKLRDAFMEAARAAETIGKGLANLPITAIGLPKIGSSAPGPGQVSIGGIAVPAPAVAPFPQIVEALKPLPSLFDRLRSAASDFGERLGGLSTGMQFAIASIAQTALNFASNLVANAGGSGGAAKTGRGIGGLLGSIGGGILGAIVGGPAGAMIGSQLGGIVGTGVGGLAGGLFDHSAKQAADSLDHLSKAANAVTEAISNIPQWFKIAQFRFGAAAPVVPLPPTGTGGGIVNGPGTSGGRGGLTSLSPVNIQTVHVHGVQDVHSLLNEIVKITQQREAAGGMDRFAFANAGIPR